MPSIFEPKTLRGVVEMMPKASTFLIDTFFTDETPSLTEKVAIDFVKESRVIAPFVHPKRGGQVLLNEGYTTKEFTTPLLAPQKVTDVERLYDRMAGEVQWNSGVSPEERAVEYLNSDLRQLEKAIARRKEWMAAQAIFGGKIPVIGENLDYEIDFEFTNTQVLDEGKKWTNPDSDPTSDLIRWSDAVQEKSGRTPNVAVCDRETMMAYVDHPRILKMLDNRRYNVGSVSPRIVSPGVTYFATNELAGIDLYCYNAIAYDDYTDPMSPEYVPLVPKGSIALLPRDGDFRTFYGSITVIPEGSADFVTYAEQMVAHTYVKRNPDRKFLQLSSRPLPAPVEVDSWFTATVL